MEGVDVSFASAIRPTHIHRGTVIRIDCDGKRRTNSFLPQRGGIRPRDRDLLDDQPPGQFVRRIFQRLKRLGASCSAVIPDNNHVAGGDGTIELAPAEKGYVDRIVGGHGWTDGWTILPHRLAGFDRI